MNLQDIKDLMKEFNDSDIYKLSLEMDDVKLELERRADSANCSSTFCCYANSRCRSADSCPCSGT